jgi:hypothetical protein
LEPDLLYMLHSLSALQTFGSWMWDCLGLYLLGETEHVKIQGAPLKMKLLVAWHFCACAWSCLKMTQWVCLTFWCMWVIMLANDSMCCLTFCASEWSHLKMIWWGCLTFFFACEGPYLKIKLCVIWHFCTCEWRCLKLKPQITNFSGFFLHASEHVSTLHF